MPNQTRVPLRLAICDDEALDRAQIAQMVQEILRAEEIRAEIFCFDSAGALLREIRMGQSFPILLLDVMMEGMDGMELAAALRAGQEEAAIIFISSNREMALRGMKWRRRAIWPSRWTRQSCAKRCCIAAPHICSRAKSCCPQLAARAGSM